MRRIFADKNPLASVASTQIRSDLTLHTNIQQTMKKIFIAFLLGIFGIACSDKPATNGGSSSVMPTPKVAGTPVYDDEVAVFETDYGNFKIALYPDVAPRHV